jgi:hypothetical protein
MAKLSIHAREGIARDPMYSKEAPATSKKLDIGRYVVYDAGFKSSFRTMG